MGVGLLIGFFLLILILISAPIIYLIFKKNNRPKFGKLIALLIVLFVTYIVFINFFDSILYFKSSTRKDLKLAALRLNDDFKILENDVQGMPERFQKTKLEISTNDRNRIISEIKNGKSYRIAEDERVLYYQILHDENIKNKIMATNYLCQEKYVRETIYKENEYVPILTIVRLDKNSNIIELERIED